MGKWVILKARAKAKTKVTTNPEERLHKLYPRLMRDDPGAVAHTQ